MANVVIALKIFPSDISVNLDEIKTRVEQSLPEDASIYKFVEEPIAFGLVALIAYIVVPEENTGKLDEVERNLSKIQEISEIQTLSVMRSL